MRYEDYKTDEVREQQVIRHLINFKGKHGYSPSYSQIAALMGVSKTRVSQIVAGLEAKGIITKDGNKARTIQVQMKI